MGTEVFQITLKNGKEIEVLFEREEKKDLQENPFPTQVTTAENPPYFRAR